MRTISSYLGLLLILLSCSSANDPDFSADEPGISIEIVDTIQVDFIGNQVVHDIDPVNGHVLFVDHKEYEQIIYIADFSGKVVYTYSKSKDTPDTYGRLLGTLKLLDENKFLAFGSQGILTYNLDGTLSSKIRPKNFSVPNGFWLGVGHGMLPYKHKFLFMGKSNIPLDSSEPEYYDEVQFLTWLDPATGEVEIFNNLPDTSLFRSGKFFHRGAMDPIAEIVDKSIYVAYGIEPAIYRFSAEPPYELVSSFRLNLPDYQYFEGDSKNVNDIRFYGNERSSGRITNILKVGDYWLVSFFPGFNATDRKSSFESKTPEGSQQFWQEMQKKYPSRTVILDSIGNLIPIPLNTALQGSPIVKRNDRYFMVAKGDPDAEHDYFEIFEIAIRLPNE